MQYGNEELRRKIKDGFKWAVVSLERGVEYFCRNEISAKGFCNEAFPERAVVLTASLLR